jgi:hypothetical protein
MQYKEVNRDIYIAAYHSDGTYQGKWGDGTIIFPHSSDDLYYAYNKDYEITSSEIKGQYVLMRNHEPIMVFEKPVIQGYFLDSSSFFVLLYDTNKTERFDLLNGPWPPVEEAYLIDLNTLTSAPLFFKEKWKKVSKVIKSFLRTDNIIIIPKRSASKIKK